MRACVHPVQRSSAPHAPPYRVKAIRLRHVPGPLHPIRSAEGPSSVSGALARDPARAQGGPPRHPGHTHRQPAPHQVQNPRAEDQGGAHHLRTHHRTEQTRGRPPRRAEDLRAVIPGESSSDRRFRRQKRSGQVKDGGRAEFQCRQLEQGSCAGHYRERAH